MKYLIVILIIFQIMQSKIIFYFNQDSDLQNWAVVNDVVMGGKSSSQFTLNADGFGVFEGHVSLANNGGFASVKYQFDKINVSCYSKIKIRLKGDGKDYQFRVKHKSRDYYFYTTTFSTTNEWQEIEIALKDMYPVFRGMALNRPNFSHNYIAQIMFLIGNKKDEDFKLMIDTIELI